MLATFPPQVGWPSEPPWQMREKRPRPSAVKAWSPNHWTAREFPLLFLKSSFKNDTTPHLRTFMVRKCFLLGVLNPHTPALSPFSQSLTSTWKTVLYCWSFCHSWHASYVPCTLHIFSPLRSRTQRGICCLPSVQKRTDCRDEVQRY